MKLNLFSSDGLLPDYLNVDIWTPPNAVPYEGPGTIQFRSLEWAGRFQRVELANPWPWAESSIDEIRAFDGPEHLASKVHFMNNAHRVLRPGGLLEIQVPDCSEGDGGDCDPTHVSRWNRSSFEYFMHEDPHLERFRLAYGVTARFRVLSMTRREWPRKLGGVVWIINTTLQAVK